MVNSIYGGRAIYDVPNLSALRAKHARALAKARSRGVAIVETISASTIVARIDHGRWIADCSCGSGVGLDRSWSEARCFGCGAVYTDIVWPPNVDAIEQELVKRPHISTRNWFPGERVDDLVAERIEAESVIDAGKGL